MFFWGLLKLKWTILLRLEYIYLYLEVDRSNGLVTAFEISRRIETLKSKLKNSPKKSENQQSVTIIFLGEETQDANVVLIRSWLE